MMDIKLKIKWIYTNINSNVTIDNHVEKRGMIPFAEGIPCNLKGIELVKGDGDFSVIIAVIVVRYDFFRFQFLFDGRTRELFSED